MKSRKRSLLENRGKYGWIFISPLIIGILLIFIPNIITTFRYSVSNIDVNNGFKLVYNGFSNYKDIFTSDAKFMPLLFNNLKKLLINVPVILIYSLFISTIINQKYKGRVIARVIFFIPVILVAGVLADMDSQVLHYTGAGQAIDENISSGMSEFSNITVLLQSLNFPQFLTEIIVNSVSNIYSITCSSGLQIYIFLAGLQEMPSSVFEAAMIEGCSKWELFWKITFPMIAPQIAINAVYTISTLATEKNELLTYTNELAFGGNQYSFATAMNIVYLLLLGIIVAVVLAIINRLSSNTEN